MNRIWALRARGGNNFYNFPQFPQYFYKFDMRLVRRVLGQFESHFKLLKNIYWKTPFKNTQKSIIDSSTQSTTPSATLHQKYTLDWIGQGISSQLRQLFVRNVLRRVTSSGASEVRRRATQQLLYGDNSRPFFALIGVSLASGAGVLTQNNEFEGICHEIRDSFERKERKEFKNIADGGEKFDEVLSVRNLEFGSLIAQGSSAAVYSAKWKNNVEDKLVNQEIDENLVNNEEKYPLGVKMMFNFYCESNSGAIIRSMCKEIVPARDISSLPSINSEDVKNLKRCPPHGNIIEISHVFTDQVPLLEDSVQKYPDALPKRLHQEGLGRNMSLFLIMKKYDTNLHDYLKLHPDLKLKNRLLLLTQLVEGAAHLSANGIAHRDLKGDNILLDTTSHELYPHLVIADFGCCLADKNIGLFLPFTSQETDRGGNAALMAPEISSAVAGPWKKLDYSKSDIWTVGTLAYEIFTSVNPFVYNKNNKIPLDSRSYNEDDLPHMSNIPNILEELVKNMLKKRVSERVGAELSGTILQIYLWAPSSWLQINSNYISDSEIMQWLLTLTTKVLCGGEREKVEFCLIQTFLKRLRFSIVRAALDWIQNTNRSLNV